MEDDILEKMKNYISESTKISNISSKFEIDVTKSLNKKKKYQPKNMDKENQAGPSTGLASSEKYLAPLIDSSEDENDEEMAEKDKCCVCKRFYVNSKTYMKLQLFAGSNVKHVGIGSTCDIVAPHVLLEEIHHLNAPVVKTKDF